MPVTAYIGFGSNLGDLYHNYLLAKEKILAHPQILIKREAPLYRSQALTLNHETQPDYLNGVIEVETDLTLYALFHFLKSVEQSMGRRTARRWAPRVVDLDILFFGDMVYQDDTLCVPHAEMINRLFVLKPLVDLIPEFIHPDLNMTVYELFSGLEPVAPVEPFVMPEVAHDF